MASRDELKRENEALRERISRLTEAGLRINASLDHATVLHEVVETARALTGAGYGVIVTIDGDGRLQDFLTSGFTPEEHRRLKEWPDGPRLFEHLRDLPGPVRVENTSIYIAELGYSENRLPVKTFLGTSLRHRGTHVGNFCIGGKAEGQAFTDEDEELLALFAAQAAAVIANARAYREEQRARFARTASDHVVQAMESRLRRDGSAQPELRLAIRGRRMEHRFDRGRCAAAMNARPDTPDPRPEPEAAWARTDRLKAEPRGPADGGFAASGLPVSGFASPTAAMHRAGSVGGRPGAGPRRRASTARTGPCRCAAKSPRPPSGSIPAGTAGSPGWRFRAASATPPKPGRAGRFALQVNARGLVAHEDPGHEEWGFSGSIQYRANGAGRGLSMKLRSASGDARSAVQSLCSRQHAGGLAGGAAFDAARRFQAHIGHGLSGPRGQALWVPFLGADAGQGAGRTLHLGASPATGPNLEAGLENARRDSGFRTGAFGTGPGSQARAPVTAGPVPVSIRRNGATRVR